MNIPIAITVLRFILAPVACFFYYTGSFRLAILVVAVAVLSDWVDGFIARRTGSTTELGAKLDPLADKFLVLLAFLTLSIRGYMDWSLTALVIGRDLLIVGTIIWLSHRGVRLEYRPVNLSKWSTALQFVALLTAFILSYCGEGHAGGFLCKGTWLRVIHPLSLLGMAWFAVLSGLNYFWIERRFLCRRYEN